MFEGWLNDDNDDDDEEDDDDDDKSEKKIWLEASQLKHSSG